MAVAAVSTPPAAGVVGTALEEGDDDDEGSSSTAAAAATAPLSSSSISSTTSPAQTATINVASTTKSPLVWKAMGGTTDRWTNSGSTAERSRLTGVGGRDEAASPAGVIKRSSVNYDVGSSDLFDREGDRRGLSPQHSASREGVLSLDPSDSHETSTTTPALTLNPSAASSSTLKGEQQQQQLHQGSPATANGTGSTVGLLSPVSPPLLPTLVPPPTITARSSLSHSSPPDWRTTTRLFGPPVTALISLVPSTTTSPLSPPSSPAFQPSPQPRDFPHHISNASHLRSAPPHPSWYYLDYEAPSAAFLYSQTSASTSSSSQPSHFATPFHPRSFGSQPLPRAHTERPQRHYDTSSSDEPPLQLQGMWNLLYWSPELWSTFLPKPKRDRNGQMQFLPRSTSRNPENTGVRPVTVISSLTASLSMFRSRSPPLEATPSDDDGSDADTEQVDVAILARRKSSTKSARRVRFQNVEEDLHRFNVPDEARDSDDGSNGSDRMGRRPAKIHIPARNDDGAAPKNKSPRRLPPALKSEVRRATSMPTNYRHFPARSVSLKVDEKLQPLSSTTPSDERRTSGPRGSVGSAFGDVVGPDRSGSNRPTEQPPIDLLMRPPPHSPPMLSAPTFPSHSVHRPLGGRSTLSGVEASQPHRRASAPPEGLLTLLPSSSDDEEELDEEAADLQATGSAPLPTMNGASVAATGLKEHSSLRSSRRVSAPSTSPSPSAQQWPSSPSHRLPLSQPIAAVAAGRHARNRTATKSQFVVSPSTGRPAQADVELLSLASLMEDEALSESSVGEPTASFAPSSASAVAAAPNFAVATESKRERWGSAATTAGATAGSGGGSRLLVDGLDSEAGYVRKARGEELIR